MDSNTALMMEKLPEHKAYLMVTRLNDGRYCVEFRKDGQRPRTSYTEHPEQVVRQAQRAGNLPVCTADAELQRTCHDQQVELVDEPVV